MDDIYEPVYDSAALEDHLLPEPVETFLLVALCWCLVAWLLRLCYMAMHLLDLQTAIKSQRLSAHDSVPLHSEVVNLDPQTKTPKHQMRDSVELLSQIGFMTSQQ